MHEQRKAHLDLVGDTQTQDALRRRHRQGDAKVMLTWGLAPELVEEGYLIGSSYTGKLHVMREGEDLRRPEMFRQRYPAAADLWGPMCEGEGYVMDPGAWNFSGHVKAWGLLFTVPVLDHLCGRCRRRRKWPRWDGTYMDIDPMRAVFKEREHDHGSRAYIYKTATYCFDCGEESPRPPRRKEVDGIYVVVPYGL